MRAVRYVLWLSLLGPSFLTLAACTRPVQETPPPAAPAVPPPPEPETSERNASPVTTAAAPNARPRPRPSEDDRRQRVVAEAAATEKPDFASLIGRSFEGVERLLGPADQAVDTPPAKEWQYRDGPCRLVVRFYPDMKTLAYRVLSYAFDSGEPAADAPSDSNAARTVNGEREAQCRTRLAARLKPER